MLSLESFEQIISTTQVILFLVQVNIPAQRIQIKQKSATYCARLKSGRIRQQIYEITASGKRSAQWH
jgi:hypothetical protein